MRFPHPGGFGLVGTILTDVLAGIVFLIVFAVVVALLIVLVRFLLTATRAAELYIANNTRKDEPAVADTPAPPAAGSRTRNTKPPAS